MTFLALRAGRPSSKTVRSIAVSPLSCKVRQAGDRTGECRFPKDPCLGYPTYLLKRNNP